MNNAGTCLALALFTVAALVGALVGLATAITLKLTGHLR